MTGQAPPVGGTTSFARGVSKEKGWWNVEKRGVPQDYMACRLITSCNMLQWWQDQYLLAGHQLPESTPNGVGAGPYRLAIMDEAMQSFNDLEKGGSIHTGLLWYIEGKSTDISYRAILLKIPFKWSISVLPVVLYRESLDEIPF